MATQVIYSNLFSESRNNVIALLTSVNVPDPTISSAGFRKWIYSRTPDVKANEFKGYPFLIVHPADADIDEDGGTLDGKSKIVYWNIEIEIVCSDRGYGDNVGKGLSYMDEITDSLAKTFMNISNRKTLTTNSMAFSNVTTSSVTTDVIENELVYSRSIILSFKSRIQVSA